MANSKLVYIGGTRVDLKTKDNFLKNIVKVIKNNKKLAVTSVNMQHLLLFGPLSKYNGVITDKFESHVDGEPIKRKASFITGSPTDKLSGSILLPEIINLASINNYKILFIGGTPESHIILGDKIRLMYPTLKYKFISPERSEISKLNTKVTKEINKFRPEIVIVSLPKPISEIWVKDNIDSLSANIFLCYGGAADFMAGVQKMAPKKISGLGLEWFWRLIHNPKRLFKRYILEGPIEYLLLENYSGLSPKSLSLSHFKKALSLSLLAIDSLSILVSLILGIIIRYNNGSLQDFAPDKLFIIIILPIMLFINLLFGSSSNDSIYIDLKSYSKGFKSSITSIAILSLISYSFGWHTSRGFLIILLLVNVIVGSSGRYALSKFIESFRSAGYLLLPVKIIGESKSRLRFQDKIKNPKFGYKEVTTNMSIQDCVSQGITIAFCADDLGKYSKLIRELENPNFIILPKLENIDASMLQPQTLLDFTILTVKHNPLSTVSLIIKRLFDILFSLSMLIFTLPFTLLISIFIIIDSRGNIFYKQDRVGKNGLLFSVYKFRTMANNSDLLIEELEHLKDSKGFLFKIKDDPRITRVGKYLRRYSLDEVPQFINVLKGDMSVVGPRPALAKEVQHYIKDSAFRHKVKPGITGLWQVSGRSDLTSSEALSLDLHYVYNWSLALDLTIIIRTIKVVLSGSGAY